MILKLKPICFDKIWGGDKLKKVYHYDCSNKAGEAWGISAHKNGSSIITNTSFKGKTLREVFRTNRELFGNYPHDEFPILIKVIDAQADLSIQVHPNDKYAKAYENSLGKTECWYILDTEPNTQIIVGHKANDIAEFKKYIENNDFESVINRFNINKGDEFNIYAGTIHAICSGTLLLEIQQSSDITYRLYDYNRLSNGKPRDLHLDKALDVIKCPDKELATEKPIQFFDYHIYKNDSETKYQTDQFGDYLFILEGSGKINDTVVNKGDFLIATSGEDYIMQGNIRYFKATIK